MANDPSVTESLKSALADIQQPALPDEFYLAPGYLILGLVALALLFFTIRFLFQRYRRDHARRLALKQLDAINPEHKQAANQALILLKQYIQTKRPGHPALTMQSHAFIAFLRQSAPINDPIPDLDLLLYGPAPSIEDTLAWLHVARQWLQQHREHALYV